MPSPSVFVPPSTTMAKWSLGLSLLLCVPFASVVAIVLAIIVLMRSSQTRKDHGKGLAIGALVMGALVLVVHLIAVAASVVGALEGTGDAPRDQVGQVTEADTIDPLKLQLGDCFDSAALDSESSETVQVTTVEVMPCEQTHDFETYYVLGVPEEEYPGEKKVLEFAVELCAEKFQGFIGRGYAKSTLEFVYFYPTERSWRFLEDTDVACVVTDPEGSIRGTLRGSDR